MKILLSSLLVFLTLNSFSQEKAWTGDTSYWYNYQKRINEKIGLEELPKSKFPFELRISSLNTILDIWTEDGKTYQGTLFFFTETSDYRPGKHKYLFIKEMIRPDTVLIIKQLIEKSKIFLLPIQDSIHGWEIGFDGSIYLIEYADQETYSFKSYWSPEAHPRISEAITITTVVNKIEELLRQQQKFDKFIRSLPNDKSYRYGNAWTKRRIKNSNRSKE